MKMIYLNIGEDMFDRVLAILRDQGVKDYEIVKRVTGKTRVREPFMDNPTWPGSHTCLLIPVRDEEKVERILQKFRSVNENAASVYQKVSCCTWEISDYFFE